jgi:hypothetical protein
MQVRFELSERFQENYRQVEEVLGNSELRQIVWLDSV